MPNGTDFLMRPVLRQVCRYESLLDGTLTLCDVGDLNDALNVFDENQRRLTER